MTVRIALATAAHLPDLDEEGPELLAALKAEGLAVDVCVWDDVSIDWASYDLVLLRTVWDYSLRHEEFLTWTRTVPRLANSADVVAWNTDKTYLRRLAEAGIPIVPTIWLEPGDTFTPPDERFVVKPTVSAGARDSAAYPGGAQQAVAHVQELLAAGRRVMVQPYVDAVDADGETAVLVFDGVVSHGARKAAILTPGDGVKNDVMSRSFVSPRQPSQAQVALALQVMEVVRSWGDDPLYARVDLLPGPVLIELEVTEPSLFLRHAPGSAERFAQAVARRAERSGGSTPRS